MTLVSLIGALSLAAIHLFAGKLRFLHVIPRSQWLSMAGGASVAYVFMHLLPELSEGQEIIHERLGDVFGFLQHHIYLLALLGLAVFYGLERLAKGNRNPDDDSEMEKSRASQEVFWVHMVSFSTYNMLIGYLLIHREENSPFSLFLFVTAMGLHFIVNDYGLSEHHEELYRRLGRWIITAAILVGWVMGFVTDLPELIIPILMAFLAGGITLNVLKEELPAERKSRFWAFLLGATLYTILLLFI